MFLTNLPMTNNSLALWRTHSKTNCSVWFGFMVFTPLSTIFQLYRGGKF